MLLSFFRLAGLPTSVPVSLGTAGSRSLCLCTAPTGRLGTLSTAPAHKRPLRPMKTTQRTTRARTRRRGARERRGSQRDVTWRRRLRSLLLRRLPRQPPQLETRTATLATGRKPIRSTGGQESEPRLLTSSHALPRHLSYPTATGLTGTPSPRRLLPSLRSPAPTPRPSRHPFRIPSGAQAPRTEKGSSKRASAPTSHPPATSTLCSTPATHTWGWSRAVMEEELLLRSSDALGRRRSTAGASRR